MCEFESLSSSAWPAAAGTLPASRSAPIAGIYDGRSGRVDTFPAAPATVLRCLTPTVRHAARRGCRATDGHAYRPGAAAVAPVPRLPIVRRSVPSGHALALSEIPRASPECHQNAVELFMRLVLEQFLRSYIRK